MDRIFMFIKKKHLYLEGGSAPTPGLYACTVYDHSIQTSSLKLLGKSKLNFMWSIVRKGE